MSTAALDGSVVTYEFLDHDKKWTWAVGEVTFADGHVCTVKEWLRTPVGQAAMDKIESEAAASKDKARACQQRLLAIRDRMEKEASGASRADKEKTSQDLAECLAESGKHRLHSRSLQDDLEKLKAGSSAQVKASTFTPSSRSATILRSSVLQVVSQARTAAVLMSSEECASTEAIATEQRSQLADRIAQLTTAVEEATNNIADMHGQIHSLEEQVKLLDTAPLAGRAIGPSAEVVALQEKVKELESSDLQGTWISTSPAVLTNHSFTFPWKDGNTLLRHKPEETRAVLTAELSFACRMPMHCVVVSSLAARGDNLYAEFSISHPTDVSMREIDRRAAAYAFPSLQHLHSNPLGAKVGLDRAIEEVEHAIGVPTGKHEGLFFGEFIANLPDTTFSNDKDAYESEIGDLLMLLDRLNNENRSLQYTLDKAAAELKKQVAAAQQDQEALNTEVARLRDIIAKLKDLADQQEKELEANRLQRQRAEQARFRRNLQPPAASADNPDYAVTMDEYTRQRDAADEAQEAFEQEKTKAEEMFERLKQYEAEGAHHVEQMRDLETALAEKDHRTAENLNALETELLDVLMQLKASEGSMRALETINAQQADELRGFRGKRNAAFSEREQHGGLTIHGASIPPQQALTMAVNPAVLSQDPLYAVTLEEYQGMQSLADEQANQVGDLTEQLAAQQQHLASLEEQLAAAQFGVPTRAEVAAFRAKRNEALAARAEEGSLPCPAEPLSAEEAVQQPIDPQQIGSEPLFVATMEELLEARNEAEKLARELAEKDKELAAHRQKRRDALDARAEEPALATTDDGVRSRGAGGEEEAAGGDARELPVDSQQIEEEPLYAVTLDEYRDRVAALADATEHAEELARELAEKEDALAAKDAEAARLADEAAAFRAKRNEALAARAEDDTLPCSEEPVTAEEAVARALEPEQIAEEPLYAVTVDELQAARDDAVRAREAGDDNAAALEAELLDVLSQLKALEGKTEALEAIGAEKDAAIEDLSQHDLRTKNSDPTKAQSTSHHMKVFEGEDWGYLLERKPHALNDAFVTDVSTACRVGRDDVSGVSFKLGSLHANVEISHNSDLSAEAIAKMVEEYHYPNMWALYERRAAPKDGLDAAEEALAEKEDALAAKDAEAARLADEAAAFRAKRNEALAARAEDDTLPCSEEPVTAEEAVARALEPEQIAEEPLYAVTVDELQAARDETKALAEELEAQKAEAEKRAATLDNTDGRLRDAEAEAARLAEELAEKDKELAAHRQKRRDALDARAEEPALATTDDGVRSRGAGGEEEAAGGDARELPVDSQQIEEEPLYAVTLDEYRDRVAALADATEHAEELARELAEKEDALAAKDAEAARLADEAAAFRAKRNEALAARAEDDTLPCSEEPVTAEEAVARALEPEQIAEEPLYAVTVDELQAARDETKALAEELEAQKAEAEKRAATLDNTDGRLRDAEAEAARLAEELAEKDKELAAHRQKRRDALDARAEEPALATTDDGVRSRGAGGEEEAAGGDARELPVDSQQIEEEPLYAVTLDEYRDRVAALADATEHAEELARELAEKEDALAAKDAEAARLADELEEKQAECMAYLDKLEEAVGLLDQARKDNDSQRKCAAAAAEVAAAALTASEEEKASLDEEVRAFRQKRLDAQTTRREDGRLPDLSATDGKKGKEARKNSLTAEDSVAPTTVEQEPLLCVKLEELQDQRDLNEQMMRDLDALGERIREAVEPGVHDRDADEELLSQLEGLLKELEDARAAERAARDVAEDKDGELAELRDLFAAEDERLRSDLDEARGDNERLQRELDLLTDKLDEAWRLFGDADAAHAEGVAKLEAFAEMIATAQEAEKEALAQLEAKEDELAELRSALDGTRGLDDRIDALEDEVEQLQKEKEIMDAELVNSQKELNDARQDVRAAEDKAAEKEREVESMTLDLDALNNRIQDLLEELEEKTDQYNQVIKDLDEFAKNQNREDEKELLQRLAAREQELFELQEARRGENDEHEKQIGVLQDQINRLRDQTDKDNTLHDGLQDEMARLRKALADAEEALRQKETENEALRDDLEGMIDEHEAQMREMEAELEDKSKEVSDALERLEEMSAMVQEAREGEESAMRLRADSDAEVFRLQKELDKLKQLQNAMSEEGTDKDGLLAQAMDAEAQLREAEEALRKKDAAMDDSEREWRNKLHNAEDLNRDLRRLLKRTMTALSSSKDTMGNSAGALDSFRDELKPMM